MQDFKLKVITVASDLKNEGLVKLETSLAKYCYDYEVIKCEWKGFGTKLIEVYNYVKNLSADYTHFLFTDAYDSYFLALEEPIYDVLKKDFNFDCVVVSCEKMCWIGGEAPPEIKNAYPQTESEWKYVNSGGYIANIQTFIEIYERNKPQYETDDQRWLTEQFLFNNYDSIYLDNGCKIFQCYSFVAENDYQYDKYGLLNLKTKSNPIVIHFNGKTDGKLIYENY